MLSTVGKRWKHASGNTVPCGDEEPPQGQFFVNIIYSSIACWILMVMGDSYYAALFDKGLFGI